MSAGTLSLWRGGGAAVTLPAGGWRALYLERGALAVGDARLGPDSGRALGSAALRLTPQAPDIRFWLWDWRFSAAPAPIEGLAPVLAHAPDGPADAVLLRLERVDLPPGSVTAPHTHAGCGLRVLIAGAIEAELDARRLSLAPGDAWLEKGPAERVVGRVGTAPAAFVRLMVLPADMAGQDSYRPWGDAKAPAQPRPARVRRDFEMRVER